MTEAIEKVHTTNGVSQLFHVKDADINSAQGNYVFTVGDVSSGKTTLQNILMYRLWKNEDIVFEYNHKNGDHRHDAILNDWVEKFSKGHFPKRTDKGMIQDFSVSFGQKRKKSLKLNFLEISGEDIKSIVPDLRGAKPKIHSQLEQYLKLAKLNKRFVFVSDSEMYNDAMDDESGLGEDILFSSLLEHLYSTKGIGLKRMNILFVAAKWDLVQHQYTGGVQEYFKKHFPNTRAFVKKSSIEASFVPFTIGSVKLESTDVVRQTPRIAFLDNRYVDHLTQWLYHSYTGRNLDGIKPIADRWLDRVRAFLGRLV